MNSRSHFIYQYLKNIYDKEIYYIGFYRNKKYFDKNEEKKEEKDKDKNEEKKENNSEEKKEERNKPKSGTMEVKNEKIIIIIMKIQIILINLKILIWSQKNIMKVK